MRNGLVGMCVRALLERELAADEWVSHDEWIEGLAAQLASVGSFEIVNECDSPVVRVAKEEYWQMAGLRFAVAAKNLVRHNRAFFPWRTRVRRRYRLWE